MKAKSAPRDGVSSGNRLETRPGRFPWLQTCRQGGPSRRSVSAVALLGVMWSVCHGEAPLHPSLGLTEAACRMLWFGGFVAGLAVLIVFLKDLFLGRSRGNSTAIHPEVAEVQKNTHATWVSRGPSRPGGEVPLSWALADSLLLCVLQEPLSQPTLPRIEALWARLESVSQTLQRAEGLSGAGPDREDPALVEKVKTLSAYLQQRTRSLGGLVRAQGEFEADVAGLQGGLERSWAQLVELHTRVTLTKDWSRGRGDLASTNAEAESVSRVVSQYRTRLQLCQDHHRDTTQLLQELTWSHTHLRDCVSDGCSSESVWTELLLQSNIEQFDKVQESFLSLDQQTSTFRAHLDGLERGSPDGQAVGPPSASSSFTSDAALIGRRHSEHAPDSSLDKPDPALPPLDKVSPRTLCERSANQLSSALGRLRKSGKRK